MWALAASSGTACGDDVQDISKERSLKIRKDGPPFLELIFGMVVHTSKPWKACF